eukprot:223352-Amphidinium_carterae.1
MDVCPYEREENIKIWKDGSRFKRSLLQCRILKRGRCHNSFSKQTLIRRLKRGGNAIACSAQHRGTRPGS